MTEIVCDVHDGDLEDAVWFSLQANRSNGVRRTQQDVRNAVQRAIVHRNGKDQADQWIGAYVGCDGKTVKAQRQLLVAKLQIATSPSRVDRNGVERVIPQPRAKPDPETATAPESDPNQIDLEDYLGVKKEQPEVTRGNTSQDGLGRALDAFCGVESKGYPKRQQPSLRPGKRPCMGPSSLTPTGRLSELSEPNNRS
jgi:hypothetical protein